MKSIYNFCCVKGDFGVSTIMGDARTKTRTTVGRFNKWSKIYNLKNNLSA